MQSQQLLPKGKVLEQEFFSLAKDGDDPANQMSKARKHQGIITKGRLAGGKEEDGIDGAGLPGPRRCASNSLIMQMCIVLAKHSQSFR